MRPATGLCFGRGGLLFLPPTFQGMICQCSLLRTASPNLKHLPVGKDSRTVVPSCGPAHFQSPSYSKGATLTICIVLYFLLFLIPFVDIELIFDGFWKIMPVALIIIILAITPSTGKTHSWLKIRGLYVKT